MLLFFVLLVIAILMAACMKLFSLCCDGASGRRRASINTGPNDQIMVFLFFFLFFPIVFACIRLCSLCCEGETNNGRRRRTSINNLGPNVRPGTVYTITSDPRGGNNTTTTMNTFPDYIWDFSAANPNSHEPAKDDKDLPTYEEVMRIEMACQANGADSVTNSAPPSNTVQNLPQSVRLPV